jgi:hypothetical protein
MRNSILAKKFRCLLGTGLVVILMAGCAAFHKARSMEAFHKAAEAYRITMDVSDFEAAANFIDPAWLDAHSAALEQMRGLRITSYEIKRFTVLEDLNEVHQEVEISYYRLDQPIERHLHQQERWAFNESLRAWRLANGFPNF